MSKIYILYKLDKRAETTDTLLYYASFDKGLLEEIILSIWEEAYDVLSNAIDDKNEVKRALALYINQFGITEIPMI